MTDPWTQIVFPGGERALELLGGDLLEYGALGFSTEGTLLLAYFPAASITPTLLEEVRGLHRALAAEGLLPSGAVETLPVANEDWVGRWRRSLGPIRAGTHLVVVPPGVQTELGPEDIALRLEPRMAFGTGEHPTTRMALELLERTVRPGDRVLDMGCGNGILSIAALLLGAGSAFGIDNEAEAVAETSENAFHHSVSDRLTVELGDVLNLEHRGRYTLLLANIFVNPILQGLPAWLGLLEPGAELILTGVQADEEQDRLLEGLAKLGLSIEETLCLEGWFAARCRTP